MHYPSSQAETWRATRFDWARGAAIRSGADLRRAGPLMSAYSQAVARLRTDQPVLINLPDPLHALAAFFGVLAQGRPCGIGDDRIAATAPTGVFHLLDAQQSPSDPRDMPVSSAPSPFITFTGGTTGAPKAILRDQASWLYSFERQGIGPGDRVATLGGLTHSLSLYAAVEALHQLADIYLLAGLRPDAQAGAIRDHAVTVLYATPTQLKRMAGAPCPSVTRLYVGGGAFDKAARVQARALFPEAEIKVFYGTSETSFVTVSDTDTPDGSVGRAYPGVRLRADGDGLLWADSPMLFRDYLLPGATQARRRDGFVSVGDMGRIDADGYVWLTGRADRIVTISDRSVSLDAVEQAVAVVDGVGHVAAVALPDTRRGHVLGIAVSGSPDRVLSHARGLPKIGRVIAVRDWPMLASGKTDYKAIEALFKERDT